MAALLVLVPSASPRAAEHSPEFIGILDKRIEEALRQHTIPGLSVAIARENALVFEKGYGFADLENRVPATAATVYRTASIAKPLTAVLVLRLAEEGKLALDTPVDGLVPGFPEKDWPVTPRQLLRPKTIAEMWTPQKTRDGAETGYGLGWKIAGTGKARTVSHSGGQAGTSTFLLLEPESGHAVALLCNLEGAPLELLAADLLKLMNAPEANTNVTTPHEPVKKRFAIVVHGGAGTAATDEAFRELRRTGLREALALGRDLLDKGAGSLDTVEAVVRLLVDHPAFNAGKGAVLNADGVAECDASIMDGRTLACGGAAATRRTRNPVSLARAVLADGRHVLLGGEGADRFAAEKGLDLMDGDYFVTPLQRELLGKARADTPPPASEAKDSRGTVGCVALDADGNLAAATSTGTFTVEVEDLAPR